MQCNSVYLYFYLFSISVHEYHPVPVSSLVKMLSLCLITLLVLLANVEGQKGKCQLDDRVKLALKTMSDSTVPAVVDCVVDMGPCDNTGDWIKNHAV